MQLTKSLLTLPILILCLSACSDKPQEATPPADGGGAAGPAAPAANHSHDEVPIGTVQIGGSMVALAQGHGVMKAGVESHLVVSMIKNDGGATIVRAWIGTEDRTKSMVAKGTFDASHNDYDLHADAPDPLPEGVQWWVEIERPDGSKAVGSADPILK